MNTLVTLDAVKATVNFAQPISLKVPIGSF